MNNQNHLEGLEKPEQIIDEIVSDLDAMHSLFVDGATHIGYSRDALRAVRPTWEDLRNAVTDDPDATSIYSSGVDFLVAFRDELRARKDLVTPLPVLFQATSGSVSTFVNVTGTTVSSISSIANISLPQDYPALLSPPGQHESYAERFSRFDPAFGNTYREIWEALYSTRSDPERAALYLIRQAFDHFFGRLAPDDEVCQSPYWKQKTGDKPYQVTRRERIQFAAAKHIKDKRRANTLEMSAKHMLAVYRRLNKAHKRGELNQDEARHALREMQSILENWANAVGI